MGLLSTAMRSLPGGFSAFIELKEGKDVTLRVIDHPHVSVRQWKQTDDVTGQVSLSAPKTRFIWPVWDYSTSSVKLLSQGKMVAEQIDKIADLWGDEMPMTCDITISTRVEAGFPKYTVTPSPQKGTMPARSALELPDVSQVVNGSVYLLDVIQGHQPPVIGPEGQEILPVQSVADAQLPAGDVVITDLDQKIDLDNIPL